MKPKYKLEQLLESNIHTGRVSGIRITASGVEYELDNDKARISEEDVTGVWRRATPRKPRAASVAKSSKKASRMNSEARA